MYRISMRNSLKQKHINSSRCNSKARQANANGVKRRYTELIHTRKEFQDQYPDHKHGDFNLTFTLEELTVRLRD